MTLLPGKNSGGIMQILKLGIEHTYFNDSITVMQSLKMGENSAKIFFTGKTIAGKDTIDISGEFTVQVEAMVVDAKLMMGNAEVHFENYGGYKMLSLDPAKTVSLVNTGNVNLRTTIRHLPHFKDTTTRVMSTFELKPNEEKDITNWIGRPDFEEDIFVYYGRYVMTTISFDQVEAVSKTSGYEFMTK
jgi:hypothetical protein